MAARTFLDLPEELRHIVSGHILLRDGHIVCLAAGAFANDCALFNSHDEPEQRRKAQNCPRFFRRFSAATAAAMTPILNIYLKHADASLQKDPDPSLVTIALVFIAFAKSLRRFTGLNILLLAYRRSPPVAMPLLNGGFVYAGNDVDFAPSRTSFNACMISFGPIALTLIQRMATAIPQLPYACYPSELALGDSWFAFSHVSFSNRNCPQPNGMDFYVTFNPRAPNTAIDASHGQITTLRSNLKWYSTDGAEGYQFGGCILQIRDSTGHMSNGACLVTSGIMIPKSDSGRTIRS